MTTFDEREQAFERRYVLDEEQSFRANARRNRLLGTWAAEKLGRTGDDAAAYAREVVQADLESPGDADVVAKLVADFSSAGVAVSEAEIRAKSGELHAIAAAEVKAAG